MSVIVEPTVLAPFEIWSVPLDEHRSIKFYEPLIVQPVVLDQGTPEECFYAEYPKLDISAVGIDFDELQSCLRSDIRMTWKRVVQKHSRELKPDEQIIRRRWLDTAEEVNDE